MRKNNIEPYGTYGQGAIPALCEKATGVWRLQMIRAVGTISAQNVDAMLIGYRWALFQPHNVWSPIYCIICVHFVRMHVACSLPAARSQD